MPKLTIPSTFALKYKKSNSIHNSTPTAMKKLFFETILVATITIASLVWNSCTKEEVTKGTIYGIVTDYATGLPISNVNIKLRPYGETTLTGNDGTYEFKDLNAGNYSLLLSKAGYNDLDDDYIIELSAGRNFQRDVQMIKQIASLQITDMAGNKLDTLDFGLEESVTSKSFNIFNNGSTTINCNLNYTCVWISSVSSLTSSIEPGQTVTVTVVIDRTRLSGGANTTFLHIVSNNGSNEIIITATGISEPTVVTSNVTSITSTAASCGGEVIDDGGSFVITRGICWSTSDIPTIENNTAGMGQGTGSYTCMMSNLSPNTVYYVRAYATNEKGTSYGAQKTFTTLSGLPSAFIDTVTNITATSAVCSGRVTENGGYAVTDRGFVWSTHQYPSLDDNHLSLGTGNGNFMGSLTNLSINTTYYVRAYATNSQGTIYSEQHSFTTTDGLPTVITTPITMVGDSLLSGGNVTSDGGFAVTARGICYGIYPYPNLSSSYYHSNNGSGTGVFASIISQPLTGTIYVRAYATNANGTSYGEQLSVNEDYFSLPSFTYNGHIYRVAPDPGNRMDWTNANDYCNNFSIYGVNDWRMPTRDELVQMYANRNEIGGFHTSSPSNSVYWSKTTSTLGYYYSVNFFTGSINSTDYMARVRPIHVE